MREHEVEAFVGRQVVVDQHAAGRGVGLDGGAENLQPRNRIEIETEEDIGFGNGPCGAPLGVGLEDHDLVDAGHPVEEIGEFIGNDAHHLVAHRAQDLGPCERRPHGIAVGIGVGDDDDPLSGTLEHLPQAFNVFFRKLHSLYQHW